MSGGIAAAPPTLPTTITSAASALRSGTVTATQLTREMLARADERDGSLGVYVSRMDAEALAQAERADRSLAAGRSASPLLGIPIGVKDVIVVDGAVTTAQSFVRDPRTDILPEASAVRSLRRAGAIVLGKTTTMEYAIGLPDPAAAFPLPRNPWDWQRWAGGSSSGTASGVASGLFLGGIGTDTGGSIRLPSAWCGVTGLKPTFGRVAKDGVIPLAPTYDTVGPIARDARDCAVLLSVIAGRDLRDECSADHPVPDYVGLLRDEPDISDLLIGVDASAAGRTGDAGEGQDLFWEAVEVLRAAGAGLVDVSLPHHEEMRTATEKGVPAEALAHYRPLLQRRWRDFGPSMRMAIGSAALTTAADYVEIQKVRRVARTALDKLFSSVDVVLTRTCSIPATPISAPRWESVLEAMQTAYWNAAGLPAMSVPIGLTEGLLPMGMQIAGKRFDEVAVLRVGHAYQQHTDHHLLEPEPGR